MPTTAKPDLVQALQDLNTRALMVARALPTAQPEQRATMLNRIIELNQLAHEIENCIIQEEEASQCILQNMQKS